MKILVIPSWYPPFGGRFFKYQAEEFAKLGHNVDVLILNEIGFTSKINSKIEASDSKFINEIRYNYHRIPKLNTINILLYIKKYKNILINYLAKNDVDVIHVHSAIWAGVVVSEIAKIKNIPYVITEHKSVFFKNKFPFSNSLRKKIDFSFKNAKKIIAVSNEMKSVLQKHTKNDITVIPNMVNTYIFRDSEKKSKNQKFIFVTVGGLVKVKGYDLLIKAFRILENKIPNKIQLNIIGSGEEESFLKKIALGCEGIHFLGYKTIEDLVEEYNKANVFVSSSRKETFGVAIVEAMSCGLPVVATKCGGAKDIINIDNGVLVETDNIDDLYIKMKLMYENYSNYNSVIIRNEIGEKYSCHVIVKQVEDVLLGK